MTFCAGVLRALSIKDYKRPLHNTGFFLLAAIPSYSTVCSDLQHLAMFLCSINTQQMAHVVFSTWNED